MNGQLCDSLLSQAADDYERAFQSASQIYGSRRIEMSAQHIREITNRQLEVDVHKIQRPRLDELVEALLNIEAHELMIREMLAEE